MKKLIVTCILFLSFLSPALVMAQPSDENSSLQISSAVSTLLLNDDFAAVLAQVKKSTANNGGFLRISSIHTSTLDGARILEVMLEERSALNFNWQPAGSIVAFFHVGPMGLIGFDGIYAKPADGQPGGGASVGNN